MSLRLASSVTSTPRSLYATGHIAKLASQRDFPPLLADEICREEALKMVANPDLQWFQKSRSPLTASVVDSVLSRLSAFRD